MGQYYIAVILGPSGEKKEFVRMWADSWSYTNGSKLMEHSYVGNKFVSAIEFALSPKGHFWKSRLVWAGDYADPEPTSDSDSDAEFDSDKNLYRICMDGVEEDKRMIIQDRLGEEYKYIVNHTKKEYVRKGESGQLVIHPLPLLTAEGNGRGGGDFRGRGENYVGLWARDVISVERDVPAGYDEVHFEFEE